MIERIWHGWTTLENADEYERLLKDEIFPGIADKGVDGYRGIGLLRRSHDKEVEFITIMRFESMNSVTEFAGDDYETAYVPSDARAILTRLDNRAQHYEVREQREYQVDPPHSAHISSQPLRVSTEPCRRDRRIRV